MEPMMTREEQAREWMQAHVSDVPTPHVPDVAAAQAPSTPAPAVIALPVERVRGDYADVYTDEIDHAPDVEGSGLRIAPVPLIGAIPFGGIVQQSGQAVLSTVAATGAPFVVLGDKGNAQPRVTGMLLYSSSAVGSFEIVGDGLQDQPGNGAQVPVGVGLAPFWIPVRRLTVRATGVGPFTLHYVVVGFEIFR